MLYFLILLVAVFFPFAGFLINRERTEIDSIGAEALCIEEILAAQR